jgi:hypothetical protein
METIGVVVVTKVITMGTIGFIGVTSMKIIDFIGGTRHCSFFQKFDNLGCLKIDQNPERKSSQHKGLTMTSSIVPTRFRVNFD